MSDLNNIPTATEATVEAYCAELYALIACDVTTYEDACMKTARLMRLTKCLRNEGNVADTIAANRAARAAAAKSVELSKAAAEATQNDAAPYYSRYTNAKGETIHGNMTLNDAIACASALGYQWGAWLNEDAGAMVGIGQFCVKDQTPVEYAFNATTAQIVDAEGFALLNCWRVRMNGQRVR